MHVSRNITILGTVLYMYLLQECVTEGTPLPLHQLDKSPQLGKGGNGTIVKYPLLYNDYAVKSVSLAPFIYMTLYMYSIIVIYMYMYVPIE